MDNGVASVTVVANEGIAADALSTTRFAACEMTNFLSRIFGAPVPVVSRASAGRVPVFVGDGPAARAAGIDVAALPHDGFALRSRTCPRATIESDTATRSTIHRRVFIQATDYTIFTPILASSFSVRS